MFIHLLLFNIKKLITILVIISLLRLIKKQFFIKKNKEVSSKLETLKSISSLKIPTNKIFYDKKTNVFSAEIINFMFVGFPHPLLQRQITTSFLLEAGDKRNLYIRIKE